MGDGSDRHKCFTCDGVFTPKTAAADPTRSSASWPTHKWGEDMSDDELREHLRTHHRYDDVDDEIREKKVEQPGPDFSGVYSDRQVMDQLHLVNHVSIDSGDDHDWEPHLHGDVAGPGQVPAKQASGLGMPEGPMSDALGGQPPQAVSPQPGTPSQLEQQPPMVNPLGGAPSPNQVTTKPRQMPADGGGAPMPGQGSQPGLGDDVTMDPKSNGADVLDGEPPTEPGSPVQAKRHMAYAIADIMADIVTTNPGLPERQAFLLARKVVEEYPVLQSQAATWNPLAFGDRAPLPPTRLHLDRKKKAQEPEGVEKVDDLKQIERGKQPRQIERGKAPKQIGGPVQAQPKALPPGTDPLAPLDFLLDEDEEKQSHIIKMRQDENQVWHAGRKRR